MGDYALKGTKPPIINGTCAVFAESALLHFQQNNVNINDLCAGACLASAKNYLVKVVRNRPLGEKVAFQGAVAFNRGMVGAFETLLDRLIIVPPYPHLTGAIGAARIALEEAEEKENISKFRGFAEIIGSTYNLSSFQGKHCGNERGWQRAFFQGDRCDRYSGAQKGRSKGESLPDLFKWREDLTLTERRVMVRL
ncbi:MAG: 2-hydroxyisocaproyl-CoA dehydratase activator [candidate division WS2 bacterium]|nr:2-hydroxyisocaproyl-CoA dehydratase activator [Candidatus Lithacetigena glycinireducens]